MNHQRGASVLLPVTSLALVTLMLTAPAAQAIELHIAPNGKDAWSGRLPQPRADGEDGPLATLIGARNAVRKLRTKGPLAEAVHVLVADGRYEMAEPLVLMPQDSGTAETPISYEAAPGGKPLFSGGRAIRGWQPGPDGVWQTRLPEVAAGQWYFEQLFVNGQRAMRARTPNKFWFYMLDFQEEPAPRRPTNAQGVESLLRQTMQEEPARSAAGRGCERPGKPFCSARRILPRSPR